METFHTDLPNIMHEMIDNEVVVVNLDNGTYYSFDGVGGQIWELLGASGGSLEGLRAQLAARFLGEPEQIASAVTKFVARLRDEGLVRVATDTAGAAAQPTAADNGERRPFVEPSLQKYTDMEALLLADPIHEVDEEGGWPNLK
jgi:hypothetical protein